MTSQQPGATSSEYESVIGIEVHVQLHTRSKMFTAAPNTYGKSPNTMTDPYTLGLPGTLPVANKEAFTLAIRVGLGLVPVRLVVGGYADNLGGVGHR